ncbi:MAG: phospholipase D-like domain-containing protein [Thermoguttaceae bacterium]|jgi:superfamily II DNA or RNA helicase|nr:phospholipase D-like domain-containing protein [Thermoguttaceae bacterium]
MNGSTGSIHRFSSRRQPLDHSFLCARLDGAHGYDRIAGYFCSSLLEVAGEQLESVAGEVRMVCNSDLTRADVETARAAQMGVRRAWCTFEPEKLLDGAGVPVRERYARLFKLLHSGKLRVRVLPDSAFGLVHGKAGVITMADGSKTCFMGSANESRSAWRMNYELVWEDTSPEAITWVQEEFDALWGSPAAVPLADFVIEDIARLSERKLVRSVREWAGAEDQTPDPAPAVIESPVYRQEVGLWEHQKYFVKLVFEEHHGPMQKARFVLADQVGLGKTLQLAMSALLIALTGEKPILVVCPKTLLWQWQGEMRDLLGMPSAVWDGRHWVDERGIEYPSSGPESIRKCPRRVGVVSSGLITRGSEVVDLLLGQSYECVILDEAHRARRRNLGANRDGEAPQPNNLLKFMYRVAEKTRSLLLATATPVQLRPIEAWDLLDVLSRGDESVLGNGWSRWRRTPDCLDLIMGRENLPNSVPEQWEWVRNPLPPKVEHRDFGILRRRLDIPDDHAVVPGQDLDRLRPPDRSRLSEMFPRFAREHHPFIRRIVRRTREQLENQIDPETHEPLLQKISVRLLGEGDKDAIRLPPYLREAYELAEEFCEKLGERMKAAGFLKTLLLRRVGSSIHAGLRTAEKLLAEWEDIEEDIDEDEEDEASGELAAVAGAEFSRSLTSEERHLLERFVAALRANQERDPKYVVVRQCLLERGWLRMGCIVFSQYRDSIQWLAEQLSEELDDEMIAVYSGPTTSGIMLGGEWAPRARDDLKLMVRRGEIRLMLGTDAASEGLNLQRLARLINLDLPWNPTKLEQRKGRIQRIGQIHDTVEVYNMRYKDSVEDRVHELLSDRLQDIFSLFGQIPDVLEDAWVAMALGEKERPKKIIDELPKSHPFELRYTHVAKINWESCRQVLDAAEKQRVLTAGW